MEEAHEADHDAVAELGAILPGGHADAEDGGDEEEDAKEEEGPGEQDKVLRPEAQLRKVPSRVMWITLVRCQKSMRSMP